MMDFNFSGKKVLVTGYFSDIGYGLSHMYLSHGAEVISTYNTTYDKSKLNNNIRLFKLNLESVDSIYKFIDDLKCENLNKIDILVNNIGVCEINPLIFQDDSKIISIMNVNLTNTIILTKYILKDFIKDGGKIINTSSIWGRVGASCEVVYSSSKAGLNLFTKSLAKEMESRDIKVLGISPGFIHTKMNNLINDEEILEIIKEIPLNRLGNVNDIVNSVKFFSSDYSNLNGEIINVDGGWMMSDL